MKRFLYRVLIALHPPAFRRAFGAEMQLIFEESANQRTLPLFADAFTSLLRQWLFRSNLWIVATALIAAFLPLAFGLELLNLSRRLYRFAPTTPETFVVVSTLTALMAIAFTLILAVAWFRFSKRLRRA
jgi:hypothetical protein